MAAGDRALDHANREISRSVLMEPLNHLEVSTVGSQEASPRPATHLLERSAVLVEPSHAGCVPVRGCSAHRDNQRDLGALRMQPLDDFGITASHTSGPGIALRQLASVLEPLENVQMPTHGRQLKDRIVLIQFTPVVIGLQPPLEIPQTTLIGG